MQFVPNQSQYEKKYMIFVCFFTHTPYKPSGNWDEAAAGGISSIQPPLGLIYALRYRYTPTHTHKDTTKLNVSISIIVT